MSLRDELLKAGLTSAHKAQKLQAATRKQEHQRKKNAPLAKDESAQQAALQQQAAAQAREKRERDRQLNLARDAEKRQREQRARARQLIDGQRLNHADAEIYYNFWDSDRHWIRATRVLPAQRRDLALGRLAIVRGEHSAFDYALIPRSNALKIAEFAPELVLVLHEESANLEDDWGNEKCDSIEQSASNTQGMLDCGSSTQ